MWTAKFFNSFGLILAIGGGILLFFYGPPQPSFNTGVSMVVEDNTPIDKTGKTAADYAKDVLKEKEKYQYWSKLALALIIIGFGFQLLAVWIN